MHYKKTIFYLLFLLPIFTSFSQKKSTQKEYYKWFDDQVGIENTGLFNGFRYSEKYRTIDGNHKFFISSEFNKGTIKYDGQIYFDIEMKYDIYEDQVIVKLSTKAGESILQLIDEKIENFNFYNVQFERVSDKNSSISNMTGFFETLYQSQNFTSLKKYKKIIKKYIKSDFVYYTFKNEIDYYIYNNNEFYLVDSKKDLIKIFPDYKKEIKDHYKKNNHMISSNYDEFIIQLSEQISNNISTSGK
ncbi:MAG: hypothetical protein ABFR32_12920 [Bacteroidota bacterium]